MHYLLWRRSTINGCNGNCHIGHSKQPFEERRRQFFEILSVQSREIQLWKNYLQFIKQKDEEKNVVIERGRKTGRKACECFSGDRSSNILAEETNGQK